ncbi:MAG: hypothetical protein HY904_09240 [Deltaproteobacteria bacterium]|nr:hypothetical protein [Deltaproteobacteria bacterium]
MGDEVRVERIDGMGSVQIRASRGGKSRGDSWPYHIHPNRQPGGDVRWIGNIMSMGEARRFQAEIDAFLGDPAKASARFELDQTAAVFPAWLIFGAALLGWLGTRFTRIRSTLRMKGTNLLLTLESPWSTPVSREFLPGQVLGVVVETSRTMARVWLELAGGQQQHHVGAAPMAVAEEWAERLGGWLGVSVRRQAAPEAARKENPTGS